MPASTWLPHGSARSALLPLACTATAASPANSRVIRSNTPFNAAISGLGSEPTSWFTEEVSTN
jgi:hypothetical protein